MEAILNREVIEKHLKDNLNNKTYSIYISYHKDFIFEGLKIKLNMDKIMVKDKLIQLIKNDIDNAKEILKNKLNYVKPSIGDFIKVNDNYFRLALRVGEGKYQYCINGSFHLGKNTCSYSGGFDFSLGSNISIELLKPTNEVKEGSFWIFSQNNIEGNNAIYMNGNFKVWKLEKI